MSQSGHIIFLSYLICCFPVCADGSSPMLCDKNQCATAKCEGRGDVTCVVDPCNKCQVSFVDASNKPVTCDGKYKNETSVINRCRRERVYKKK